MQRLEKFGACIFFFQSVCGIVAFAVTTQESGTFALVTAAIVALGFTVLAILREDWSSIMVGLSAAAAPLAILCLLAPQAALSDIFLGVYGFLALGLPAIVAWFVKSDEVFVQRFFGILPAIGGLKYLNAWLWGRWIHRGAR